MYQEIIGTTLKEIRKGKKLTVKYLTKGLISPQHYYKVEKGDAFLSSNFLFEILDRMNVSYKEFSLLINSNISVKKKCFLQTLSKILMGKVKISSLDTILWTIR